jgi:hypothetical protein
MQENAAQSSFLSSRSGGWVAGWLLLLLLLLLLHCERLLACGRYKPPTTSFCWAVGERGHRPWPWPRPRRGFVPIGRSLARRIPKSPAAAAAAAAIPSEPNIARDESGGSIPQKRPTPAGALNGSTLSLSFFAPTPTAASTTASKATSGEPVVFLRALRRAGPACSRERRARRRPYVNDPAVYNCNSVSRLIVQ